MVDNSNPVGFVLTSLIDMIAVESARVTISLLDVELSVIF